MALRHRRNQPLRQRCERHAMEEKVETGRKLGRQPGWQLWNMSKRVSEVISLAVRTRTHFEQVRRSGKWDAEYLVELEKMVVEFECSADRARVVWEQLQGGPISGDRKLDRACGASEIVEHHREDDERLERIFAIWHNNGFMQYFELKDEYEAFTLAVGDRPPWRVMTRLNEHDI
jgi:hypothetical protein